MTHLVQIGDRVTLWCGDAETIIDQLPSRRFTLIFLAKDIDGVGVFRLARHHPDRRYVKPVITLRTFLDNDLLNYALQKESEPDDFILDTDMGDGFLMEAIYRSGRVGVGITKDPEVLVKVFERLMPVVDNGGGQVTECRIS